MPDWFAHLMLAFVASTCMRLDPWKRVIFFIGNVMPDLMRFLVVVDKVINATPFYVFVTDPVNTASHSLVGVLAFSLFLSIFFEPKLPANELGGAAGQAIPGKPHLLARIRARWLGASRSPLLLLFMGGVAHLFLDTFMWPYGGGLMWLFPLNEAWFKWSFGAWWPSTFDGITWLSPFFVAAIIVDVAIAYKHQHGGRP